MLPRWTRTLLLVLLAGSVSMPTVAGSVRVAVAANFTAPMQQIAAAFTRDTGHRALVAYGSSAKLYAQIRMGAPFELFLSADQDKPARLEAEGLALADSRTPYALGRLVLWSKQPGLVAEPEVLLHSERYRYLAVANPRLAPYGMAAAQTLERLNATAATTARLVLGENIAQTYQFVFSGNAEIGFVALSQVIKAGEIGEGSGWRVPAKMHDPIRQDAVLLSRGANNPAARALLAYLRSPAAVAIMERYGYGH